MGHEHLHVERDGCASAAHATPSLLAEYASGALCESLSLVVACHLTFCPPCRARVARLEALAGGILAEVAGAPPNLADLPAAMARLAAAPAAPHTRPAVPCCGTLPLPLPLRQRVGEPDALRWSALLPGVEQALLDGFAPDQVSLVRAEPGVSIPDHGHGGEEATLVLAGRLRDDGRDFGRGDLSLVDATCRHSPVILGPETCLCLFVLTGPLEFTDAPGA